MQMGEPLAIGGSPRRQEQFCEMVRDSVGTVEGGLCLKMTHS